MKKTINSFILLFIIFSFFGCKDMSIINYEDCIAKTTFKLPEGSKAHIIYGNRMLDLYVNQNLDEGEYFICFNSECNQRYKHHYNLIEIELDTITLTGKMTKDVPISFFTKAFIPQMLSYQVEIYGNRYWIQKYDLYDLIKMAINTDTVQASKLPTSHYERRNFQCSLPNARVIGSYEYERK